MKQGDFETLYARWRSWQKGADKTEVDWASDFPEWADLVGAASDVMLGTIEYNEELGRLAEVFAASEEGEELCDFAKDHISQCLPVLRALSGSSLAACRWQVYEAAASAGVGAEDILRKGLEDSAPYARRRAILALARLRPRDARELAEVFMSDEDAYIRQAAIDLITVAGDQNFRSTALASMMNDPSPHVREYAARAVESLV